MLTAAEGAAGNDAEIDLDDLLGLTHHGETAAGNDTEASKTYATMLQTWTNERMSPELLPFARQPVSDLREMLEHQQEVLDNIEVASPDDVFTKFISELEIERIKFVLRNYIRIRLLKIERFTQHILEDPERRICLSNEELEYAQGFLHIVKKYHKESFLDQLPESLQSLDEEEMIQRPNLDDSVFCRVLEDVGSLQINDSETIMMQKDHMYLLRYSKIRRLLLDNRVELL